MNQYPEEDAFTHEFIVPEAEVVSYEVLEKDAFDCEILTERFRDEKVSLLVEAAKEIWQFPYVRVIQTGLEVSGASVGLTDLEMGRFPNIQPFAIVEEIGADVEESKYLAMPVEGRRGILLRSRR